MYQISNSQYLEIRKLLDKYATVPATDDKMRNTKRRAKICIRKLINAKKV